MRDVVTLGYPKAGPDGLTVLQDELTRRNFARCKSMPRRHGRCYSNGSPRGQSDFKAGRCLALDDRKIIARVDNDRVFADLSCLSNGTAGHICLYLLK